MIQVVESMENVKAARLRNVEVMEIVFGQKQMENVKVVPKLHVASFHKMTVNKGFVDITVNGMIHLACAIL